MCYIYIYIYTHSDSSKIITENAANMKNNCIYRKVFLIRKINTQIANNIKNSSNNELS